MDPKEARNEEALTQEVLILFENYINFSYHSGQVDYHTNSPGMFSKQYFSFSL